MRDLAPGITRQRLLIEGIYTNAITEEVVREYLLSIASHLNLKPYGKPMIHSPEGIGKEENEGFDAFLPLIDSGISLYIWSSKKFFAAVLFTCKEFDTKAAIEYTSEFFGTTEIESQGF